jgi:hypothetical protein
MVDIELQMEGALDRRVADAIRRRVRIVRRQFDASGEWRVTVGPAETRGEWDVGVRAPSGWHVNSFTGVIEGLPAFVEQRLREYVQPLDAQATADRRTQQERQS